MMTAPPELLREFEKRFDQLTAREQRSSKAKKVELFVKAAHASLQKSLIKELEDPAGELGLTNDWKRVTNAIGLIVKRQKRADKLYVVMEDEEDASIPTLVVPKAKKEEFNLEEMPDQIRKTTGWKDPIDFVSVYAHLVKAQAQDAIMEEKRKRDEDMPSPSKRVTRASDKKEEVAKPTPDVAMEDAVKDKKVGKPRGPAYKLKTEIEMTTDLQKVFEERILNSIVELTLGELLGIAKPEFHAKFSDMIKRKR
ncbi:hypothetical protein L7F22_044929 [Adiantum nelumboides]|nr:hypothetical protein [Adiantum nelumboides]